MRLTAILKLRCPHCLQGAVFYRLWRMHPHCPVCGILYEREEGYFLMAIFIGYILGILAVIPVCLGLYLARAPLPAYLIGSGLTLTLLSPLIFRYARVLWLHLDELLDPRP